MIARLLTLGLALVALAPSLTLAPSSARAQPPALVLHAEGSLGVMLSDRYRDRFDLGGAAIGRIGIELLGPALELRVGAGGGWFPVTDQRPGTLFPVTLGARGTFLVDDSALGGPFVELDAGLAVTGDLPRFVVDAGVGWAFAPLPELLVGPFARWLMIVQDPGDPVPDPASLIFVGVDVALRIPLGGSAPASVAPPSDTDGDGVSDDIDRCESEPEDVDGTSDDDGCPDLDDDSDGIPDTDDACPRAPEVRNGHDDEDGCPDEAPLAPQIVEVPIDRAEPPPELLAEVVLFRLGSSRVSPRFRPPIDAVCATLAARPEMRVRVIGHADEQGTAAGNHRLGAERAGAVAEQLVLCGVSPTRIESVSYGDSRPSCDEPTEACREERRRVGYELLGPRPE